MMVIELVGVPGSGKTTICEEVKKKMPNIVLTRNDILLPQNNYSRLKSFLYRVFLYIRFFYFRKKYNKRYYSRMINFIHSLFLYKDKYNDCIFLLDEGIIAHISALFYDEKTISTPKALQIVHAFTKKWNTIVVDCTIPLVVAAKRIKERQKKSDRYNVDNKELQLSLLESQRKKLDELISYCSSSLYHIELKESVDDNVMALVEIIKNERDC